jgi:hypothetical protein
LLRVALVTFRPDPKPARRVVDDSFSRAVFAEEQHCVACGKPAGSAHHVLSRSLRGDDVIENGIAVCGSGTTGCHGDYHRGDPEVKRLLGAAILRRPRKLGYLSGKLGEEAAREFLRRVYMTEAA